MPDLERTYNIPLRKGYRKAPKYKRANKAIRVVREFLQRHMKSNNVKLGPFLNKKILERGRKNIAHHVEVKAVKEKDIVKAELASAKDLRFLEFEKKEEEKKGLLERVTGKSPLEKSSQKEEEKPKEDVKEEKTEKEKVLEKEPEKVEKKIEEKKIPEVKKIDKTYEVKKKESQRIGRTSKKTKVKERTRKTKYG